MAASLEAGHCERLARRRVHRRLIHRCPPLGVRAAQGAIADDIDESWHPTREAMDVTERVDLEDVPYGAGQPQPVAHVGVRLGLFEGQQMVARRDGLPEVDDGAVCLRRRPWGAPCYRAATRSPLRPTKTDRMHGLFQP